MFRRIDSNANGTVTFDEFSSYILFQEGDKQPTSLLDGQLYQEQPFPDRNKRKNRHTDQIIAIDMDVEGNVYYTGSRDGTVRAWDATDLMHINTFHFAPPKAFINDILFDRSERELYVAGLDRVISVYNDQYQLVRVYKGKHVHYSVSRPEKFIYSIPTHMKLEFNQPVDSENEADVKRFITNAKAQRFTSDAYLTKTQNSIYTPIILTDFVSVPSSIANTSFGGKVYLSVGYDEGTIQLYDITKTPGDPAVLIDVAHKVSIVVWNWECILIIGNSGNHTQVGSHVYYQ
jgi:WD40 repeat protein